MSSVFNLKRFGMLFKKHTVENYRGYLMSMFVLLGLLGISQGSVVYKTKMPISVDAQIINYIIFLLISGAIFTSNVFINLGDKRKTIATLTLPASSFEKFMVGWVYSYFLFVTLFTAVFYGLVFILSLVGNWPAGSVHYFNVFSNDPKIYNVFIAYTVLHAIVIYGAIYFKKMHFIKTAFVFFIIGLVIWLFNDQVLQWIIHHDISGNPPFAGLSFFDGHEYYNAELSGETGHRLTVYLFLLLAVIFWCASYFRLKEKQV